MIRKSAWEKLTVLYVHSSADLYGSDRALLNLVSQLPKAIRPIVVLPEEGPLSERLYERGIITKVFPLAVPRLYYLHPRRVHRLLLLPFELLICWRRLRRLIRIEDVDVVHINVSFLLGPAWVARRCGKPIIWHWREVLPERGWGREILIGAAERWATRIICISNAVRRQFRDRAKTTVVFDAVAPEEMAGGKPLGLGRELGLGQDSFCVGTIGRLNDRKGHDVLIRAAARVLERFPNTFFPIVGDVYKRNYEVRKRLESLADELGIRSRIVFTGFRSDVPAIMDLLDIFVLSSSLPEGFGIVQLEAMAKGKPIVATNEGGPLDVVIHGETGFLVPPNDPEQLAARIVELLEDPELRATMGRKGHQRFLDLFTIERQVREVVELYASVAGKRPESGGRH